MNDKKFWEIEVDFDVLCLCRSISLPLGWIFISGGKIDKDTYSSKCYKVRQLTEDSALEKELIPDMQLPRINHSIVFFNQQIFVFSGKTSH